MLCWNVYVSSFNDGEITTMNIFNHGSFYNDCVKAKKKFKEDRDAFAEQVRRSLMYYFWSKCEWEIILNHWPSGEFYNLRKTVTWKQLREFAGYDDDYHRMNQDMSLELRVFPEKNRFRPLKIDVYQQVMNNWDIFIDYLWEHRKELRARK